MSEAVGGGRQRGRGELSVHLWAAAAFAALVALLFGDLLLGGGVDIPSHAQGDTARWYVWMRLFGYAELRAGNLPLWNPHTFSGMPYVGTFQSSIFYPPNLIYLLADLRRAITLEFSVTLFVLAMSTFVWLRAKGSRAISAFVAAVVLTFGSTVTLRVLAGQLSVLETFAWWPLLLRAVDAQARRFDAVWLLVGIGAVTLMILAGHPPTVLQAGAATAFYALPMLVASERRGALVGSLVPLAVVPPLLAAVQLLLGLHTAGEALRRAGMSYAFAVSHSFPPEQLLTLLGPDLFGNADRFNLTYFGRVFYWDATYFFGIVGLLLAIHGALYGTSRARNVALGLAAFLCLAAMGGYTPLYRFFYEWVPGFDYVRAPSKFLFFSSVFVAWLVALGVDRLLESSAGVRRTAAVAGGLAVLAAGLALWAGAAPVSLSEGGGPMALLTSLTRDPGFVVEGVAEDWHARMVSGAWIAFATALLALALLLAALRSPRAAHVLIGVAVFELLLFARFGRGTTRMTIELDLRPQVVEAYAFSGRTRVHETAAPSNVALARRNYAIWGYDPVVLGRYIEFMMWTQGMDWRDIRKPTRFVPHHHHPLHAMLRAAHQLDWKTKEHVERPDVLTRFVFIDDAIVVQRGQVLDAMGAPDFDVRRTVVLERPPEPPPLAGAKQAPRLWVLGESTDHVDLEIDLRAPAILLVTDAYSTGWRAVPLHGSVQQAYDLMPANYVLRAVPLSAGHHRIRLEYAPPAYRLGLLVSGTALVGYLGAWAVVGWRRRADGDGYAPARAQEPSRAVGAADSEEEGR